MSSLTRKQKVAACAAQLEAAHFHLRAGLFVGLPEGVAEAILEASGAIGTAEAHLGLPASDAPRRSVCPPCRRAYELSASGHPGCSGASGGFSRPSQEPASPAADGKPTVTASLYEAEEKIAEAIHALHAAHPELLVGGVYVIPAEEAADLPEVRVTISLREAQVASQATQSTYPHTKRSRAGVPKRS